MDFSEKQILLVAGPALSSTYLDILEWAASNADVATSTISFFLCMRICDYPKKKVLIAPRGIQCQKMKEALHLFVYLGDMGHFLLEVIQVF